MNRKTLGMVLLLVAVAGTISIVTATVLAQGKPGKKRIVYSRVEANPSKVLTSVGQNELVSTPAFPSSGVTSVKWMKVERIAEGFHVSGQATIRDMRPNAAYVWSVRVRDPVKKILVAEKRYDTQIFQIPQDTAELNPTFEDVVTPSLQPGTYKIELVLYEVPAGGVRRLSDPVVMELQLMAKNTVQVTFGP